MQYAHQLGGLYQDFHLVFAQPTGRPTETRWIDREFEDFIKANGLPPVAFHSLRHLSTSEKLKLPGGDIKAVQGDNGQAQARMVTDTYAHTCDGDRRKIASLMEDAWFAEDKDADRNADVEELLSGLENASPEKLQAIKAILNL